MYRLQISEDNGSALMVNHDDDNREEWNSESSSLNEYTHTDGLLELEGVLTIYCFGNIIIGIELQLSIMP